MPIELFLSPVMRPLVRVHSALNSYHADNEHYSPIIIDNLKNPSTFLVRIEVGTGSKSFSVFRGFGDHQYSSRLYQMTRSRAVKGAYKVYNAEDLEVPIALLRAGIRSNVTLMQTAGSQTELGFHAVSHTSDALDHYRVFTLADGNIYHWTSKGHFLERVRNIGQKEAEVRERVGRAVPHPNRRGFDLFLNEDIVNLEMAITTALICYIEAWNTARGYGGIYGPKQPHPYSR